MTKIESAHFAQPALVTFCCDDLSQTPALQSGRKSTGQAWYLAQCKAKEGIKDCKSSSPTQNEGDESTHLSPLHAVVVSVGMVGVQVCRSVHHGH